MSDSRFLTKNGVELDEWISVPQCHGKLISYGQNNCPVVICWEETFLAQFPGWLCP